ncbi:MAG: hypothetical protein U0694_18170 [Anaerolineae bacterium]
MFGSDTLDSLFVLWAFAFQGVLIAHFALRKWAFDSALRYGWVVYALGVPAAVLSILLLLNGKQWALWLGGFLCLVWSLLGFTVEYVRHINWRDPLRWSIFVPYVALYLATILFYWFPLALISRPLWYIYAVLFAVSTLLNVTSHTPSRRPVQHPL